MMQPCILWSTLIIFSWTLQYFNRVHEVDKISINFSKKIPFKGKSMICVQFGPKLQHLTPHDLPYAKDVFETL